MRAGAFGVSPDRRRLVEKECRCYVQSERDPLEPTSADAIAELQNPMPHNPTPSASLMKSIS